MGIQKMTWRHILVFINCCLITATGNGLYNQCTGIFYDPVSEEFGIGKGVLTLYVTIGYVATMLFLPYAGKLLDRLGARVIATAETLVLAAVFFIYSRATNVAFFYVGGALSALSTAFALYLIVPAMINRWFSKKVGLLVGLASAFSGIFGMIFNPVGQAVISSAGWRNGYLFYVVLTLVLALPLSIFAFPGHPEDVGLRAYGDTGEAQTVQPKEIETAIGVEYSEAKRMVPFWFLIAMTALTPMICMVNSYIPSYATSVGMTAATGALLATFTQMGNLISKFGFGTISDKKPKVALALAFGCTFVGLVALLILGGTGGAVVLVCGALYGCCNCTTPVLNPLVARKTFGSKDMNTIWAHISPVAAIAAAVGGSAWGFIYDSTQSYSLCLLIAAVMCVVAFILGTMALNLGKGILLKVQGKVSS